MKAKPTLTLTKGSEARDAGTLARLFRKLAGRDPTPDEIANAKRKLEAHAMTREPPKRAGSDQTRPLDLDAILGPLEAASAVRRTRETGDLFYLLRYLGAGHPVTPEIADLIAEIGDERSKDERLAAPFPTKAIVEREIARHVAAIKAGDPDTIAAVRALGLKPERPTKAAIALAAILIGETERAIREIRNPQATRLKHRRRT
jgi:hypothetical protein